MKSVFGAFCVACVAIESGVNAQDTAMMTDRLRMNDFGMFGTSAEPLPIDVKVLFGTEDNLRLPSAFNLGNIADVTRSNLGNIADVSRSNLVFTPDDRDTMINKILTLVLYQKSSQTDDNVLSNDILDTMNIKFPDQAILAQLKATVECRKSNDNDTVRQCVRAFIDTVRDRISAPTLFDQQRLSDFAGYRVVFQYRNGSEFRYGWRYPLAYWNMYGSRIHRNACGFGKAIGSYYYC